MRKNTALKILNPVLALLALAQLLSGTLHALLPRDVFGVVHPWGGALLAACIALHVTLNWSWVSANFLKKPQAK